MKNSVFSERSLAPSAKVRGLRASVLSWPAWLRVLAVLPVCAILWLGVVWALAENIA
jgi:hypothetical protein